DTGMGEGRGIDDDEIHAFLAGRLNAIHQCAFVIGLEGAALRTSRRGLRHQGAIDLRKRGRPIRFRLACPEQVQVGSVQHQYVAGSLGSHVVVQISEIARNLPQFRRTCLARRAWVVSQIQSAACWRGDGITQIPSAVFSSAPVTWPVLRYEMLPSGVTMTVK